MSIENLINNLQAGDNVGASNAFNDIISDKLQVALDTKKIEVASSLVTRKAPSEQE